MKVSIRFLLVLALLGLNSVATAAKDGKEIEVSVPAAPSSIIITGPGTPPAQTPQDPNLTIRLQVGKNGEFIKPKDILEAVKFIREALPSAHLDALALSHGWERPGSKRNPAKDPRTWRLALSSYLFKTWRLGDRKTRLGRQMACISWGEYSYDAIYMSVVNEEIMDHELKVRNDTPEGYDVYAAGALANRLLNNCSSVK